MLNIIKVENDDICKEFLGSRVWVCRAITNTVTSTKMNGKVIFVAVSKSINISISTLAAFLCATLWCCDLFILFFHLTRHHFLMTSFCTPFFLHTFFHFKITRVETATKCYLSQLIKFNTFETKINIIDFFILFFAAKKNLTNAINRKITSQRIRFPLKLSYLWLLLISPATIERRRYFSGTKCECNCCEWAKTFPINLSQ